MTPRDDLVRLARAELGESYRKHRDCSGFTAWLYRQIGVTIPEGSVAQFSAGPRVEPGRGEDWQVGDLLFWDTVGAPPGHVAMYVGGGKVIHALNDQQGIVESDWDANMGGPYMGARRFLRDAPDPKAPEERPRRRRRRRVRKLVHP